MLACEKNTYGHVRGLLHPYSETGEPQEIRCKKCPPNSYTKEGVVAQSVADCKCGLGYNGAEGKCTGESFLQNVTFQYR